MAFATDFNFKPGYLHYKGKDLRYYVSYRDNVNIKLSRLYHIYYTNPNQPYNYSFLISDIETSGRIIDGKTTYDACDCIGKGSDIGFDNMFRVLDNVQLDGRFLKAGYNPHLILSGDTNTSLIHKTSYSDIAAWKNKYGEDHYTDFEIVRTDSKLIINRKYSTQTSFESHTTIPANSFDQSLIPYVFMFYVQAAGGGGGPSYWESGGGGGGGGGAVIFMYNFNKGNLYIRLGAPGAGGYYDDSPQSPQGGSGSYSLIYNESHEFSIYVKAGYGAYGTDQWITKGGPGGEVSFGEFLPPNLHTMALSAFNSKFRDTCFIMCYADGGHGGNASHVSIGEPATAATGATMTYTDAVMNYTFAHEGGGIAFGGGGGGSATSTGITAPQAANNPGNSASDSDRGNGGSGAASKGVVVTSAKGGDGGTSEFQIWY